METGPAPMPTHGSTTSTKADGFRRLEVITGVGRRRRWTDEEKGKRWRCLSDGKETLFQIAKRACAKEPHEQAYPGDAFRWFTVGGMFTEAEYTKEKEREVYAQLDRHRR
jgi:hypothetical protein